MLSNLRYRLRGLFRRNSIEAELNEELRAHIEQQAEKYIQAGMSPQEAARRARLEFGGIEQVKEECRDTWGIRFINELGRDVRYGLRQLHRSPGFTVVAILTLALGIGATTAVLSVMESILWKALPFPQPQCLVMIWEKNLKRVGQRSVSVPNYTAWRSQSAAFEQMAAFRWVGLVNLRAGKEVGRARVGAISANYFSTLETKPTLGRDFRPDEEGNRSRVAILSHEVWVRKFHASGNVLGSSVSLNGKPSTIVGVAPASLGGLNLNDAGVFIPLSLGSTDSAQRDLHTLEVIGRLKHGITVAQAQADIDTVASKLALEFPKTNEGWGAKLFPLQKALTGGYRTTFLFFLCAAGFVLLIACVNVASLLLSRATCRQPEIALRTALGAGRKRLIRQLLTESMLLALIGSGFGILLADWGGRAFVYLASTSHLGIPRLAEVGIDGHVLGLALAVSCLTALAFGLTPALMALRPRVSEALKGSVRQAGGRGRARMQDALVIAEVGLATVLLVGAGLFLSSLFRLERAPLGFNPHDRIEFYVSASGPKYEATAHVDSFYEQLIDKAKSIPGVEDAAAASHLPLTSADDCNFVIDGRPKPAPGEEPWALMSIITPRYLQTMEIPLLRGRYFARRDDAHSPRVVIINENLARHYFAGGDPLGRTISVSFAANGASVRPQKAQIIGVAGNVKEVGIDEIPFDAIYFPFAQNPEGGMFVVTQVSTGARSVAAELRREASSLDKDLPVTNFRTLGQVVSDSLNGNWFNMILIQAFAVLALILAGVGVFGVMSYRVSQRTHEIGIRMALGARSDDVLRLVIRHALALAVSGLAIGLCASLILGTALHDTLYLVPYRSNGFIYGVSTHDPVTLSSTAIFLTAVALLACYIPARRAAKVDPMVALRYE